MTHSPSFPIQVETSAEPATPEQKTFFHTLIPFAASIFDDLSKKPRYIETKLLPLDDVDIASREALEALQDIFTTGTLKYLTYQGGWQERWVGRLGEEKPRLLRFWEPTLWKAHPLFFSEASIDVLIALFNLFLLFPPKKSVLKKKPPNPKANPEQAKEIQREVQRTRRALAAQWRYLAKHLPETNGDLLAFSIFYEHAKAHLPAEVSTNEIWFESPLIFLGYFHHSKKIEDQGLHIIKKLLAPTIAPWIPWYGIILRETWKREQRLYPRREKYEDFLQYFEQMARVWGHAIRTFQRAERYELLVPWLEIFAFWHQEDVLAKHWPAWLQHVSYPQRMSDRQAIADTFLDALDLIRLLQDITEEVRELHPIEREAPHRIFLQTYEETGFAKVFQGYTETREKLRPTIG
ncbi:MAG: hypothetical protein H6728_05990 [Myxococcales bacterium]|nr:hypothetical protein [Myxococcales bacterium]